MKNTEAKLSALEQGEKSLWDLIDDEFSLSYAEWVTVLRTVADSLESTFVQPKVVRYDDLIEDQDRAILALCKAKEV